MIVRNVLSAALIITSALLVDATPGDGTTQSVESLVLARVNGEAITVREMLAIFTSRHGGHARFLGGHDEAREYLNSLIEDRLLIQEAYLLGLDEDPVAEALVTRFVDTKSSDLLIKREVEEKAKPTDEDIREVWGTYFDSYYHLRQIAVNEKREADEIRAAIMAGVDGEYFARTCSVARSRLKGGNVVASWGTMEPEVERAVHEMESGELSPVIETKSGYEVIQVIEKVSIPPPELKDVREHIESVLKRRNLEQRKADYSSELWDRYGVEIQLTDLSLASLLRIVDAAPSTVVAKWSGGELYLKDLVEAEELRAWAALPPRMAAVEIDNRLRTTVNAPLVVLEARRLAVHEEPELAAEIQVYQDFVVESLLFRDQMFRKLVVTDEEGRKYYEENRREFIKVEERRVAHVLVATEADALRVRDELMNGAEFEKVVRTSSRDSLSARSGGDLGWITEAKVPPAFREVLSMDVGDVSNPMKSDSGWHIVKVTEIRPERVLTFDEVKDRINERALDAKKRETRQNWIDKLREAATIEVDDEAIDRFVRENEMKSFDAPAPKHEIPAGEIKPH